jgi:hypothetical protein
MNLTSLLVTLLVAMQVARALQSPEHQVLTESRGSPSALTESRGSPTALTQSRGSTSAMMPASPELQYGRLNRNGERLRATQWSSGSLSPDWRVLPPGFRWGRRQPSWTDSSHYRSQSPSVPSSPDGIEQASRYSTPSRGPSGDHQLSPEHERSSSPSLQSHRSSSPSLQSHRAASSRRSSPIRLTATDRITGTSERTNPYVSQPFRADRSRSHTPLGQRIKSSVKKVLKNVGKGLKKCVSCGQPGSSSRVTTHGAPRRQRWRYAAGRAVLV